MNTINFVSVFYYICFLDENEVIIQNELLSQVDHCKRIGLNDMEEFPPMVVMRLN